MGGQCCSLEKGVTNVLPKESSEKALDGAMDGAKDHAAKAVEDLKEQAEEALKEQVPCLSMFPCCEGDDSSESGSDGGPITDANGVVLQVGQRLALNDDSMGGCVVKAVTPDEVTFLFDAGSEWSYDQHKIKDWYEMRVV
mmetsp:Transcript_105135/g.322324  ORF Transcript_105135/g.322324 Transcript_105135/m.322324 type:complete len:140 (-) Transcript_105135:44-463(-)